MVHPVLAYFAYTWLDGTLRSSMLLHKSLEEDAENSQARLLLSLVPLPFSFFLVLSGLFTNCSSSTTRCTEHLTEFPLLRPPLPHPLAAPVRRKGGKSKMARERVCHFQTAR